MLYILSKICLSIQKWYNYKCVYSPTTVRHQQRGLHAKPGRTKQRYACHSLEGPEFRRLTPTKPPAAELWLPLSVPSCGCEAKSRPASACGKHRDVEHSPQRPQRRDLAHTCWTSAAVSTPGRSRTHWTCRRVASWLSARNYRLSGIPNFWLPGFLVAI